MFNQDYTAKLLDLEDAIIKNVENKSDQLFIQIELPRKMHICPASGHQTERVHDYRRQIIKDIPLGRSTLYYRVVVFSVPLQGHMLHCKGCCGSVLSTYRKTVTERLQPQPFTGLLIS